MSTETQHDISQSLIEMQENLAQLTSENERTKRLQQSSEEINNILRGDKDLTPLCTDILSYLATFTSATVGTFYTTDLNGNQELTAGYALNKKAYKNKVIEPGIGLVGQVALEQKIIRFNNLPKDYLQTTSGTGEANVTYLTGLPLIYNNKLVGVLELGTFEVIPEEHMRTLSGHTENIAIAVNAAKSKMRTETLLQNIREKEAELSGQMNAINKSNLAVEFDMKGYVTSANENFLDVMGYQLEDLIGKHHSILVDATYKNSAEYKQFWEDLRAGKSHNGEVLRINKAGDIVWLHSSYNPIYNKDNKLVKVLKLAIDITEQKDKQLQNSQQVSSLNQAAIVSETDAQGNITFVNEMFCEISQYTEKELIGKNHRILKSGTQPDGLFVGMWKAISLGRVWRGNICNKAKDGSYYWVATTIMPFRNLRGNIFKYVAVRFDITEQVNQKQELLKQAEEMQSQQEELKQTNEELQEQTMKLKEQQEELQAANEELEEQTQIVEQKNHDLEIARTDIEHKAKQLEISSKYKSEFLANMSHELRTPLNSLLILSDDLAQNKENNLSVDQIESAQVISKSGHDLLNLINEILDLSKVEAGRMDLNVKSINLHEFATSLRRDFTHVAEDKGLKFDIIVDNDLPESFESDQQRLAQVLKNLLSNAFKFTDKGEVIASFKKNANLIAFSVKDSGIGIAVDKQDIIFEAFQQADGSNSRKYGGTGLGLSISRELAKLLRGNISLESKPGQGSTFTLTIPLELPQEMQSKKAVPVKPQKAVMTTYDSQFLNYPTLDDQRNEISESDNVVLIIEDDTDFARVLAAQANQKSLKYLCAATGEDGLKLAAKFQPNAIILDLDLPGIDGHMVLKELKSNPDLRHIPVHIISANEKSMEPIKSGAVEYLTKPVNKKQLEGAFSRIEDLISRKMKNLLIIEDNKNLRKSIIKLIGNGDVKCHEASTGEEALNVCNKEKVDCIVLDIGLPDMTGFELIKQLEKDQEGHVPPIVVYTGKELTREEDEELRQHAETIIVKGVKSEERLLDETALFLHRTLRNLPKKKQEMITGLYDNEKVFTDKKVLLVDDDMRNVFALGKVLREKGLEVVKAENGKVALDVLGKNADIDIVLMDIMMPEMDGYECMQNIRKEKKYAHLPVIALTAKAMKEDRQKCIDAGANDYISKPVDVERLFSLMKIWLKNRK
ncbi:MAG: response regulator [Flavobacteriales bacterium]|nr:response regulator [Flavobacteriales bacterium]MCB9447814.1 response regulator [Flavobacteriales bacterium]